VENQRSGQLSKVLVKHTYTGNMGAVTISILTSFIVDHIEEAFSASAKVVMSCADTFIIKSRRWQYVSMICPNSVLP